MCREVTLIIKYFDDQGKFSTLFLRYSGTGDHPLQEGVVASGCRAAVACVA